MGPHRRNFQCLPISPNQSCGALGHLCGKLCGILNTPPRARLKLASCTASSGRSLGRKKIMLQWLVFMPITSYLFAPAERCWSWQQCPSNKTKMAATCCLTFQPCHPRRTSPSLVLPPSTSVTSAGAGLRQTRQTKNEPKLATSTL